MGDSGDVPEPEDRCDAVTRVDDKYWKVLRQLYFFGQVCPSRPPHLSSKSDVDERLECG